MVETEASTATRPCIEDWTQAPWRKLEQQVFRLQKRIYRAQQRGNVQAVHSLQRLLMKSRAARMLAVRRVTQDNHGKKTAGVDGIKAVGPQVRLHFVDRLRQPETIRAQPVRQVLIPKPGKADKRKLGIPVLLDRAHQALVKAALEPQWEARFEPDSYGFRPGRSCQDALKAVFKQVAFAPKYVLDADIKGCFDHISHPALLRKLDVPARIRRAIKAWLTAGIMTTEGWTPTTAGTPQGGVVSPLLMNVALHGLQTAVEAAYVRRTRTTNGDEGKAIRPRLLRYADDFVVLCRDLDGITAAQEAAERWLADMGLTLSPTKTRITHTLEPYQGNVGFDFLGCTVRQWPAGKYHATRLKGKVSTGFNVSITPSKSAITRHIADSAGHGAEDAYLLPGRPHQPAQPADPRLEQVLPTRRSHRGVHSLRPGSARPAPPLESPAAPEQVRSVDRSPVLAHQAAPALVLPDCGGAAARSPYRHQA